MVATRKSGNGGFKSHPPKASIKQTLKQSQKEEKKMAKMRMVTRTVKVTKVNVMCLDIEKGEAFNEYATISGVFDNPEKLLKACKEVLDTDTEKAVAIVEKKEIEQLYGMTEQEFISIAKLLPPRQGKETEEPENMKANESEEV